MLIRSASFECLCVMILTLDPLLSSRRKVPNWTYLIAISTGMFTTLLSVHVNFSSSGRVGLVPGVHGVCKDNTTHAVVTRIIVRVVNLLKLSMQECRTTYVYNDSYTHSAGKINHAHSLSPLLAPWVQLEL